MFKTKLAGVLTSAALFSTMMAAPASAGVSVNAGVSLKPNRQGCVVEKITVASFSLTSETIRITTTGDGKQNRVVKLEPMSGKNFKRTICKPLSKRDRLATYNIRTVVTHQGDHEAEASFSGVVRQKGRG